MKYSEYYGLNPAATAHFVSEEQATATTNGTLSKMENVEFIPSDEPTREEFYTRDELIRLLVKMRRELNALYSKGVIDVDAKHVHLYEKLFLELFPDTYLIEKRGDCPYPWEYRTYIDDTLFLCILDDERHAEIQAVQEAAQ